jgi:transposase-like protein
VLDQNKWHKNCLKKSMKYIRLNKETKEELRKIIKTSPTYRSRMRAQAFLLNSEGVKIPEIRKILGVSQRTLYRWFSKFARRTFASLYS